MNRVDRIVLDPNRTYACTRTARTGVRVTRGNISSYGALEFEVKWLNYPSESNTWEPWRSLRKTDKLHNFLISKNLRHLIPKEFRLDYV